MSHVLKHNVADQIAYFRAYDTDGTAKTDLDSSTTGLTLSVFRVGASSVSISSLSDKAADDSTHADGAIRSVGGNLYTIDIPDAATATQVPSIVVRGSYTGGVVEGLEHPIVAYDPAVNYASATKASDIETDTQDIQNRLPATLNSGRMVSYVEDVGTSAQDQIADAVANLDPSGKGADTLGGQIARTYTNSEEAEIIIGAIVQDTVDIQNRLPAALVSGRMDASVGAMANNVITAAAMASDASAEIADAVWDEAYAGHTTAGTYGKLMDTLRKANLSIDGEVTSEITPTTLTFSSNVVATSSAYAHAVLLFVSGPLAGENSPIVSYTNTNGVVVLEEPLTAAPSAGDEFVIIAGSHVHLVADIQAGLATAAQLTTVEGKIDTIDTIADKLDTTIELDGAVYRFTENALEQAPTGGGGSGTGSFTVTLTIKNNTNVPVPECDVSVTSSNNSSTTGLIAVGRTNASGVVQVQLDEGTYYGWRQKAGYTFVNPFTLVVDSAGAVTIS